MREEIRRLHELDARKSLIKIAQLLAIWGLCALLALKADSHLAALPCYVLMGFCFHGLGVLAHEGAHGSLLGWGWVDRLVGFFCGLPISFPCNNYRATHLLHHMYENSELDPDNLEAQFPHPIPRVLVYYGFYLVGIYLYVVQLMLTGPFRSRTWRDRLICLAETLCLLAFYGLLWRTAFDYGAVDTLLRCWLLGIPFGAFIANVRGLAEHTQLEHDRPPDSLRSTRTTLSHPFICFFFNNQNYHLEHHLFPMVPWYHLPRLHKLLLPIFLEHGASISSRGYLEGFWSGVIYGPLTTFHYNDRLEPVRNSAGALPGRPEN